MAQAVPLTPFQMSQTHDHQVQDISIGVEGLTIAQTVEALPQENAVILDRAPGVLPSFTDAQKDVRVGLVRGGNFYPVWVEWVNGRACVRGMNSEGNMMAITPSEVRDEGFRFQSEARMSLEELISFFPRPAPSTPASRKKAQVKKVVVAGGSNPSTPGSNPPTPPSGP